MQIIKFPHNTPSDAPPIASEQKSEAAQTVSVPFKWKKLYLKSHFAPAFYFLAPHRRHALKMLYGVCRLLDDAVDTGSPEAAGVLTNWKSAILTGNIEPLAPFGQAALAKEFLEIVERFDIPKFALIDLIEKGVGVDLRQSRFETPMDLESYCYGVAGTVGLACLPIFGVPWQEANDYAIRLGITVQWINSLRDVGTDAQLGRIYLPLDHLSRFGYTESDLFARKSSPAFYELMRYESGVARSHYNRAMELLPVRWEKELLPARIMGSVYLKLLNKLEKQGFPVYERKVVLNLWQKGLATLEAIRN